MALHNGPIIENERKQISEMHLLPKFVLK